MAIVHFGIQAGTAGGVPRTHFTSPFHDAM
jgi:hypothetical protein